MERRIKRQTKKDPEGRLLMLFEVVDVINGEERHSGERPLFDTREKAQAWIDRHRPR
ncbi:hypothetical protein [Roseovarius indicus]|uniref:hypothetical protein n=1 Tax=Roseovarius indicus TaxID=540747 RepID=UPI000A5D144B|nr:hypothetical protein [Roseovarius indicus]